MYKHCISLQGPEESLHLSALSLQKESNRPQLNKVE